MRKMSITTIERGVISLASQLETLGFECEVSKKVGDMIDDGNGRERDASVVELRYYLTDPSAPCSEFLVANFAQFFSSDYSFLRKGEPLKETPCYGEEKWTKMRAQGLPCRILDNKKFKVCPAYQMDLSLTLRNNDRLFQLWRYAKHRCMIDDALRTAQADYDSRTNWRPGWGTKAARDQALADCIKYWTED